MAILYDVPEGQALYIDGPCTVRITAASTEPTIDVPVNIVPAKVGNANPQQKPATKKEPA